MTDQRAICDQRTGEAGNEAEEWNRNERPTLNAKARRRESANEEERHGNESWMPSFRGEFLPASTVVFFLMAVEGRKRRRREREGEGEGEEEARGKRKEEERRTRQLDK